LIFALDVKELDEARRLVGLLAEHVGVFKVGLELFIAQGPRVIQEVRAAGARRVFLDLKLHDIPATMAAAAASAARLGVDLLTCHCDQPGIFTDVDLGGVELLGITVLTSLGHEDLTAMGYRPELADPQALVLHRARMALAAGCRGVVCSGREAAAVRQALGPEPLIICPGIRPAGGQVQDQKRVVTAGQAIRDGASMVVVGRPIRTADSPADAAAALVSEIAENIINMPS
jgi:orotidine-5'-phosphate decarboxylase